jgi:signal peptidase I
MVSHTEEDAAAPTGPRHRRKSPPRRHNRWLSFIVEIATVTFLALLITVVLRVFVVEAFYVPSESMFATLTTDDRILAEKISYLHRDVERGDIVVFADPGGWLRPTEVDDPGPVRRFGEFVGVLPRKGRGHLVKRVIGVGGDTVACCDRTGRLTVNGVPLDESPYLAAGAKPSTVRFSVKVPADKLWLMGDNRAESADSRAHLGGPGGGFVPVDDVVGRACCVIWPSDRMTRLRRPATFENPGLTK